jgi:hypothetical protein
MKQQLPNIVVLSLGLATVVLGSTIHSVAPIVCGAVVALIGLIGYVVTAA